MSLLPHQQHASTGLTKLGFFFVQLDATTLSHEKSVKIGKKNKKLRTYKTHVNWLYVVRVDLVRISHYSFLPT